MYVTDCRHGYRATVEGLKQKPQPDGADTNVPLLSSGQLQDGISGQVSTVLSHTRQEEESDG